MKKMNEMRSFVAIGAGLLAAAFGLVGCESSAPRGATPIDGPQQAPQSAAAQAPNGATLWSQNCQRCHNLRSPDSYNAEEWEVAVQHMRVRAKLTGVQARAIEEFLKSASAH